MVADAQERAEATRRLPWPARLVVAALAVVGAITLVQWVVAVFAWLVMVAVLMVVLLGLAFWVATEKRHR